MCGIYLIIPVGVFTNMPKLKRLNTIKYFELYFDMSLMSLSMVSHSLPNIVVIFTVTISVNSIFCINELLYVNHISLLPYFLYITKNALK